LCLLPGEGDQAAIAWISGPMPKSAIIRFRL
jgi:hypothetical protein